MLLFFPFSEAQSKNVPNLHPRFPCLSIAGPSASPRSSSPARARSQSTTYVPPLVFRSLPNSPHRSVQSSPPSSTGSGSWSDECADRSSTHSRGSWQTQGSASLSSSGSNNDSGFQSSSSTSPRLTTTTKRSRPWSFRQAVSSHREGSRRSKQKAEAEEREGKHAQPADRVARRQATVRSLMTSLDTDSECSRASSFDGSTTSRSQHGERFPIVSSRRWNNVGQFRNVVDDSVGSPCQERCASALEKRALRVDAPGWYPEPTKPSDLQRPRSAPPKRTLAVSFDDSALQIRCVTPDRDSLSSSDSEVEQVGGKHHLYDWPGSPLRSRTPSIAAREEDQGLGHGLPYYESPRTVQAICQMSTEVGTRNGWQEVETSTASSNSYATPHTSPDTGFLPNHPVRRSFHSYIRRGVTTHAQQRSRPSSALGFSTRVLQPQHSPNDSSKSSDGVSLGNVVAPSSGRHDTYLAEAPGARQRDTANRRGKCLWAHKTRVESALLG